VHRTSISFSAEILCHDSSLLCLCIVLCHCSFTAFLAHRSFTSFCALVICRDPLLWFSSAVLLPFSLPSFPVVVLLFKDMRMSKSRSQHSHYHLLGRLLLLHLRLLLLPFACSTIPVSSRRIFACSTFLNSHDLPPEQSPLFEKPHAYMWESTESFLMQPREEHDPSRYEKSTQGMCPGLISQLKFNTMEKFVDAIVIARVNYRCCSIPSISAVVFLRRSFISFCAGILCGYYYSLPSLLQVIL
jgi:hypothetical protein